MRKAFMVVAALSLMLVSCSESNIQKAQEVAALVKKNCHIAVNIASVAAAFSAANPVVTTVAAMAAAICSQVQDEEGNSSIIFQHYAQSAPVQGISDQEWLARIELAQVEQQEPPLPAPDPPETVAPKPEPVPLPEPKPDDDDCVAVVNGVCIQEEKK